jgi:hypothetical protein
MKSLIVLRQAPISNLLEYIFIVKCNVVKISSFKETLHESRFLFVSDIVWSLFFESIIIYIETSDVGFNKPDSTQINVVLPEPFSIDNNSFAIF